MTVQEIAAQIRHAARESPTNRTEPNRTEPNERTNERTRPRENDTPGLNEGEYAGARRGLAGPEPAEDRD